jgi:hypothetical protein
MKDDFQQFAKSLNAEHEKEINTLFVFYDRIDILSKDFEKQNFNLEHCETMQAINN